MAWAITQSGIVSHLANWFSTLPGGWIGFMAATIVVFIVLGCVLEGLPAVVLLAPIVFPIARKLGIHDIHYAMVIVAAMNVGLMMPPIGIGFYLACRIGDAPPDEVMRAIGLISQHCGRGLRDCRGPGLLNHCAVTVGSAEASTSLVVTSSPCRRG